VVQVVVGVSVSHVGQGLTGPAIAVAAIGFGAGLGGAALLLIATRRFGPAVRGPARFLALAGIVLGGAGLVWVRHDLQALAMFGGLSLLFIIFLVSGIEWAAGSWEGARNGKRGLVVLCVVLAATAFVGAMIVAATAPSALGFRFQSYEGTLNRLVPRALSATHPSGCISGTQFPAVPGFGKLAQVCSGSGEVEFYATGTYLEGDYAYVYNPHPPASGSGESCVLHLDGPWWEFGPGGGGAPCPSGFTYLPGG
jgi:hypothetical protein